MPFLVRIQDPDYEAEVVTVHLVCKEYGQTPSSYYFPHLENAHCRFAIDREVMSIYNNWHTRMTEKMEREAKMKGSKFKT